MATIMRQRRVVGRFRLARRSLQTKTARKRRGRLGEPSLPECNPFVNHAPLSKGRISRIEDEDENEDENGRRAIPAAGSLSDRVQK